MYSELFFHDGDTGQIIVHVLRPGNSHSNRWYVGILKRVVRAIRARYPDMILTILGLFMKWFPPASQRGRIGGNIKAK